MLTKKEVCIFYDFSGDGSVSFTMPVCRVCLKSLADRMVRDRQRCLPSGLVNVFMAQNNRKKNR